nr:MAG TPA: hypothetical protein [Bacteriophage sp.]
MGRKNNRDPIPIVVYFTIRLQVNQGCILHNHSERFCPYIL